MRKFDAIFYALWILILIAINAGCDPIPAEDPASALSNVSPTGVPLEVAHYGETAEERHALIKMLSLRAADPAPTGTLAAQHAPLCSIFFGGVCSCSYAALDTVGTPVRSGRGAGHYSDAYMPFGGMSGSIWNMFLLQQ